MAATDEKTPQYSNLTFEGLDSGTKKEDARGFRSVDFTDVESGTDSYAASVSVSSGDPYARNQSQSSAFRAPASRTPLQSIRSSLSNAVDYVSNLALVWPRFVQSRSQEVDPETHSFFQGDHLLAKARAEQLRTAAKCANATPSPRHNHNHNHSHSHGGGSSSSTTTFAPWQAWLVLNNVPLYIASALITTYILVFLFAASAAHPFVWLFWPLQTRFADVCLGLYLHYAILAIAHSFLHASSRNPGYLDRGWAYAHAFFERLRALPRRVLVEASVWTAGGTKDGTDDNNSSSSSKDSIDLDIDNDNDNASLPASSPSLESSVSFAGYSNIPPSSAPIATTAHPSDIPGSIAIPASGSSSIPSIESPSSPSSSSSSSSSYTYTSMHPGGILIGPADQAAVVHPTYCPYCKVWRPERAGHSTASGMCVARLDHFCPWLQAPIGLHNHRHYVLFMFHTAVACTVAIILMLNALYQRLSFEERGGSALSTLPFLILRPISLILVLASIFLMIAAGVAVNRLVVAFPDLCINITAVERKYVATSVLCDAMKDRVVCPACCTIFSSYSSFLSLFLVSFVLFSFVENSRLSLPRLLMWKNSSQTILLPSSRHVPMHHHHPHPPPQ